MAPKKAKMLVQDIFNNLMPVVNKRPIVAPKEAPAETPIMYGSAIGFLNMPWKITPALARAIPTNIATKILGSLICEIMAKLRGSMLSASTKKLTGGIRLPIIIVVSFILKFAEPTEEAKITSKISIIINTNVYFNVLLIVFIYQISENKSLK